MVIISPKVTLQAPKEKLKSSRVRSNRHVAEWFPKAVLDRPNVQMMKSIEKGDGSDQTEDCQAD